MIIKEFFPWVLGIAALLWMAGPSRAGEPPLVAADLAAEIQNLPSRRAQDPIQPLQKRLVELIHSDPGSSERRALQEAVSLILIVRQTRISPAPPRDVKGILVTDSNGWYVNR
jgi:hypothetical protein